MLATVGADAEIVLTERAKHAGEIARAAAARRDARHRLGRRRHDQRRGLAADRIDDRAGDRGVRVGRWIRARPRPPRATPTPRSGTPSAALRIRSTSACSAIATSSTSPASASTLRSATRSTSAPAAARAYFTTGLSMVWSYQPAHYDIRADGLTLSGAHLMVAFANGPQYGNGIVLCGTARFDDGWLGDGGGR